MTHTHTSAPPTLINLCCVQVPCVTTGTCFQSSKSAHVASDMLPMKKPIRYSCNSTMYVCWLASGLCAFLPYFLPRDSPLLLLATHCATPHRWRQQKPGAVGALLLRNSAVLSSTPITLAAHPSHVHCVARRSSCWVASHTALCAETLCVPIASLMLCPRCCHHKTTT